MSFLQKLHNTVTPLTDMRGIKIIFPANMGSAVVMHLQYLDNM